MKLKSIKASKAVASAGSRGRGTPGPEVFVRTQDLGDRRLQLLLGVKPRQR